MQTSKDKVRCVLTTGRLRIEGDVHVVAGSRLTDTLNSKAKDFVAVTDATVSDTATGVQTAPLPYVAVNRMSVEAVYPVD